MLNERQPTTVSGESDAAEPSSRNAKAPSDRVFENEAAVVRVPDDREILPIGRPVGIDDLLGDPARGATGEGYSRQRSRRHPTAEQSPSERDGELSPRGDRQDIGVRQADRASVGSAGAGHEDLEWIPLPGGAVHDRPVGREASSTDPSPTERDREEIVGGPGLDGGRNPEPRRLSRYAGSRQELQRERDVFQRLESRARPLGEHPVDDPRESRSEGLGERDVLFQDRGHGLDARRLLEGMAARNHLREDDAQRELVGPLVDGLGAHLLRGHVARRAQHRAGIGSSQLGLFVGRRRDVSVDQLRHAEIEQLDPLVAGQKDVLRLDVAVDHTLLVRGRERLRELGRPVGRLPRRDRVATEPLAQRLALEELGDEIRISLVRAEIEDHEEVRVVESPGRPGFLLETAQAIGIRREAGGQDLDGDVAADPRITGAVHFAHAAGPERAHDSYGRREGRREGMTEAYGCSSRGS